MVGGLPGAAAVPGGGFSGSTSSTANLRLGVVGSAESPAEDSGSGSPDHDDKRALRAERNRQSAAASRERKKHHIKDLETRAARLSEEVARLQVADHERVRARVVAEERLQRENEELKREVQALRGQVGSIPAFVHCQACGSAVNCSAATAPPPTSSHPLARPPGPGGLVGHRGVGWSGPQGRRTPPLEPPPPPRPSDGGGRG